MFYPPVYARNRIEKELEMQRISVSFNANFYLFRHPPDSVPFGPLNRLLCVEIAIIF
jgi:hypothetical protein